MERAYGQRSVMSSLVLPDLALRAPEPIANIVTLVNIMAQNLTDQGMFLARRLSRGTGC